MDKKIIIDPQLKSKFNNLEKYHGFFTRNGGVSIGSFSSLNCSHNSIDKVINIEKNRKIVCNEFSLKSENLIFINQIHSNKVIHINEKNKNKKFSADAMITDYPGIALAILTADCAPIIFFGKKFVGIVHVGWKGLINGIIDETVELLQKKGEKPRDLICSVGPHLKVNSFKVGKDFISSVKDKNRNYEDFIKKKKNEYFFDFSECISENLKKKKISNFSISNYDTFSNPTLFFSYRYYKNKNQDCGRQISVVGIKKKI